MKAFLKTLIIVLLPLCGYSVSFAYSDQELQSMAEQHIIVGARGLVFENSDFKDILKQGTPGGFILFDYDAPSKGIFERNIQSKEQLKDLIAEIKKNSTIQPFISIDQEGGLVNRLKSKYGFKTQTPSAKKLASLKTTQASASIKNLTEQLSNTGFNLNFGTVVDLDYGTKSNAIGKYGRAFSKKTEIVEKLARLSITLHKKNNVIATLKHYPGHGSALTDSHEGITNVTKTFQEKELVPFKNLSSTAGAIMTGHIINEKIDTLPASLSKKHLDTLKKKFGFKGLIITDDLGMKGITKNYSQEEAAVMALQAGNHLVIISNNMEIYDKDLFLKTRDAIVLAVKTGKIDMVNFEKSFKKILEVKREYSILK